MCFKCETQTKQIINNNDNVIVSYFIVELSEGCAISVDLIQINIGVMITMRTLSARNRTKVAYVDAHARKTGSPWVLFIWLQTCCSVQVGKLLQAHLSNNMKAPIKDSDIEFQQFSDTVWFLDTLRGLTKFAAVPSNICQSLCYLFIELSVIHCTPFTKRCCSTCDEQWKVVQGIRRWSGRSASRSKELLIILHRVVFK